MTIERQRVIWQNWAGAPGYSNFYSKGTMSTNAPDIRSFFEAIKALIPSGITFTYPSTVDVFNEVSGAQTSSYSYAPAMTTTTATATGNYSGGSGGVVNWMTGDYVNSRRVRGRTFLVPLGNGAYDATGSLTPTAITTIQTAATALITAFGTDLAVWRRPGPGTLGSAHSVIASSVPDLAAVLRTRRT